MVKFGSVCSGIEAASVAWMPLGWVPAWFSEIEPFPSALLEHHYPEIPNLGDMTSLPDRILSGEVEAPDVFCGGTPCQAFSVAGKRQSLDDERGNLSLTFCEIANAIDDIRHKQGKQPSVIFWENVPGVLNTKDNAFGCFLGELAGESCALEPSGGRWTNAGFVLGPKRAIAWRILDAQYFGLAQRRRRVFVVASARNGFDPAKVLFEFDGVRRDIAPSREQGQKATGDAGAGTNQAGFRKLTFESYAQDETASTMMARDYKSYTDLVAYSFDSLSSNSMKSSNPHSGCREVNLSKTLDTTIPCHSKNQGGIALNNCLNPEHPQCWRVYDPAGVAPSLQAGEARGNIIAFNSRQYPVSGAVSQAVAIQSTVIGRKPENGPQGPGYDDSGVCFTQTAVDRHAVATATAVRRLTPVECERLMGFPDGYTAIPWRGKSAEDCPDGHRYKALGNSWAVPNVRWIGARIAAKLNRKNLSPQKPDRKNQLDSPLCAN